MGARHRRGSRRAAQITRIGVATATATAMAVSVAPPQVPVKPAVHQSVDLAAAIRLLPNHDQVPDITGGLGTTIYDASQTLADQLIRAVVNGISLTAFAQAAGVDPQSLVNALLTKVPADLLPGILGALSLDLPILDNILPALSDGDGALLGQVLNLLGVDEVTHGTLTGLLALLGLDLSDPLNLSNLLGGQNFVNLVTAGPTFTALKLLGLDLGWVPSLPNSVAKEINGTPYLKIGLNGILDLLTGLLDNADPATLALQVPLIDGILGGLQLPGLPDLSGLGVVDKVTALVGVLRNIIPTGVLPDILDVRITPTIGIGLGAFAAAMAYKQVIADLPNQPGGGAYTGDPLLGSLTILPLILINNPARPDGGAFARFGSLAALLGIDTVNPRTEVTGVGNGILGTDLTPLGLHVGGANVLPVLVDATYEYQPLSDLASWPNPFTLFNNLAAGLSPTYMLRGLSLDGLVGDLTPQLTSALADAAAGKPLALNLYLTLHSATLPALEPLYLASDFLNLVGLAPIAQIPMRIANALAPALRILTDIGYSNVVRNPDGTYTRNFANAGTETPFLSFPNIDFGLALSDTINALFGGIQKELGPNPTPNTPNVLANLLNALFGGGGLGGLLGGATPLAAQTASTLPNANARLFSAGPEVAAIESGKGTAATTSDTTGQTSSEDEQTDPTAADKAAADKAAADALAAKAAAEAADKAAAEKAAADKLAADKAAAEKAAADALAAKAAAEAADKAAAEKLVADKAAAAKLEAQKSTPEVLPTPKHAMPEGDLGDGGGKIVEKPSDTVGNGPKHAKPEQNVVRDSPNFSTNAPDSNGAAKDRKDPVTPATPASPAAPTAGDSPSEANAAA